MNFDIIALTGSRNKNNLVSPINIEVENAELNWTLTD